jgi:predicted Zn-dependent peptidase
VTEELQKLRQEEISFEEMQRAKKQCQSHFLSELETTFDQALQLGLWETLVSWEKVQSHTQQIDAVTTDQALQCAREFLNPARAVICDMVPSPG